MASAKKSTGQKKKTTPKKTPAWRSEPYRKNASTENYTGRVTVAFLFLFLACCIAVSYFVKEGKIILAVSGFMSGILGYGYWACAICFLWAAFILFKGGNRTSLRVFCVLLIPVLFSALVDVFSYSASSGEFSITAETERLFSSGQIFKSGGVLSGLMVYALVTLLSKLGTGIVLFILMIVSVAFAVSEPDSWFAKPPRQHVKEKTEQLRSARFSPKDLILINEENSEPIAFPEDFEEKPVQVPVPVKKTRPQTDPQARRQIRKDIPLDDGKDNLFSVKETKTAESVPMSKTRTRTDRVKPVTIEEAEEISGIKMEATSDPVSCRKAASTKADMKQPEKITKKDVEKEARKVAAAISNESEPVQQYVYPDTALLLRSKKSGADSREEILANKERLENALHSFGIFSSVVNITHGPTVTRYDIELEQGVKLTKVTNLSNDIALSLGVSNVRIAPIPDEISTVGIEVPNKIVNTVGLRDIIESENFYNAKSKLTFAIGKDIAGNAICGNISKLPHLLIAGTTGSGKSVCMNSLIISLLYKARPDEVKFIMIDPKMVELGIYNSIPHLYVPVVTDPKKAAGALQWAVVEMLKRYRLFSEVGVRDLETYNAYCRSNGEEPLPQMVIVIDELADLMMAASKEVEESICRIAQMGRASGQHLIIATQRPSADVITGLMKANIPSRIAFAVSSTLESRIILDQGGADKLIGHGDMLYAPIGCGKPLRVQGAFVSDDEREKVIQFISKHMDGSVEQNEELTQFMERSAEGKNGGDNAAVAEKESGGLAGEYDEMLPQAAEVVLEMKQCSVSMLQRRLKLGYSRAARIVDQMEELGIVGPYEGAKPRSVPIDRDGWNQLQVQLGLASEDDFALAAEMNEENQMQDENI